MGSFGGHALPGSFFIIFAIWWTFSMFNRYFSSLKRNTQFTSTPMYPCSCLCGRLREWPMEALVKLFFVAVGFSLEIITGSTDGKFTSLGNGQHATMFFFFGLSAVCDLLLYCKAPIPKGTDYITVILALGIEGLLFHFHLHGRTPLDVLLHTLLGYVIYLNILSVALEMRYRHSILAALSRSYFFMLQGTWFWQVGFILYNPYPNAEPWKEDDHDQMMIATMFFAWHCAIVLLIVLAIGGFVACYHRRFGGYNEDDVAMKRLIHTGANGQTLISMNEESDSDIEFQKPVAK